MVKTQNETSDRYCETRSLRNDKNTSFKRAHFCLVTHQNIQHFQFA